jgi:hypothetical protein
LLPEHMYYKQSCDPRPTLSSSILYFNKYNEYHQ